MIRRIIADYKNRLEFKQEQLTALLAQEETARQSDSIMFDKLVTKLEKEIRTYEGYIEFLKGLE